MFAFYSFLSPFHGKLTLHIIKTNRAVLVFLPSLEFIIAFLACLKAGIVAVPVFPPHPARKDTLVMFTKIVQACGASFALTSSSYDHLKKLSALKDAVTRFKSSNQNPTAEWPENLTWLSTDKISKKNTVQQLPTLDPSDLAFLQVDLLVPRKES